MVSHDKNVMLHLILSVLMERMQWCHGQCHWHHVMPTPMVLHKQKGYVAPHFYHLDLRNAMVPFSILTASYVTNAGIIITNGVT